jgi:hypothetical protein
MTVRVKTTGKAGGGGDSLTSNHNQTAVQAAGLKLETGVKAGGVLIEDRR